MNMAGHRPALIHRNCQMFYGNSNMIFGGKQYENEKEIF